MSKPALGRGLGSLLPRRGQTPADPEAPKVTPGVASLISGGRLNREAPQQPEVITGGRETAEKRRTLRPLLIGADLLLCGMAGWLVYRQPAIRADDLAICITAVLLGAALGCAACLLSNAPPGSAND